MLPSPLVIVDQVYVDDLVVLETKHDTPIARYTHAPHSGLISLEGVKPEAGSIRAGWICRLLQPEQDPPKSRHQARWQACALVALVQSPQPLVLDLHRPAIAYSALRLMSSGPVPTRSHGGPIRGSRPAMWSRGTTCCTPWATSPACPHAAHRTSPVPSALVMPLSARMIGLLRPRRKPSTSSAA